MGEQNPANPHRHTIKRAAHYRHGQEKESIAMGMCADMDGDAAGQGALPSQPLRMQVTE